jgi:hypothetical protein
MVIFQHRKLNRLMLRISVNGKQEKQIQYFADYPTKLKSSSIGLDFLYTLPDSIQLFTKARKIN